MPYQAQCSIISSKRAFCHAVPTVWNNLPELVISDLTISIGTFKSRLKTELYSRVFDTDL